MVSLVIDWLIYQCAHSFIRFLSEASILRGAGLKPLNFRFVRHYLKPDASTLKALLMDNFFPISILEFLVN